MDTKSQSTIFLSQAVAKIFYYGNVQIAFIDPLWAWISETHYIVSTSQIFKLLFELV